MTKEELVNRTKEERSKFIENIEELVNVLNDNVGYLEDLVKNLDEGSDLDDDVSIDDLDTVLEEIKDAEIDLIDICKTISEEVNSFDDVFIGDIEDELEEMMEETE